MIPSKGQPLEVIGWYPNGTAAIGVVPYGQGQIILTNPHPNITGSRAERWREYAMGRYALRWGWTWKMVAEGQKVIRTNKDLDGPKPDWALAKAMLSYAYKKALD